MMALDEYALSISDGGGALSPSTLYAIPTVGSSPRESETEVQMLQQHRMGSQLCGEGSLLDTVLAAMWDESMAEGLFR